MEDLTVTFADFEFSARHRRLVQGGTTVRIGSRAFDILSTLIAHAGSVVTKEQLLSAVWPDTYVDEANLRVHVSALRKALGEASAEMPMIENIPGRGYAFVAPVVAIEQSLAAIPPSLEGLTNLPFSTVLPIGRDDFIRAVINQVGNSRLVTVTGAGGMGKTTAALAAARYMVDLFPDGVVFVDFSTVTDGASVRQTLLSAVELVFGAAGPIEEVGSFLRGRRALLVFDNCEHLVEAIAELTMRTLQACPRIHILATSREPLRVASEWVQRLPSLNVPPEGRTHSAAEVGTFSAARLFLDRVSESVGGFVLQDGDAEVVVDICRRLDGIALALELAAGRVESFGLRGLADALDDRFRVLRQGRRTALPRHQTLRATLDWSFGILTGDEQRVLRRTAIFGGSFTADAALTTVADDGDDRIKLEDIVSGLVAKSLIVVDFGEGGGRYRLLETTRSYCLEKLAEAVEAARAAEQHAGYYAALFEKASTAWETHERVGWRDRYAPEIDNLRVALKWAFSPSGSAETAVALTIAAIPLWFQLSLVRERLLAAQQAAEILARQSHPAPRQRMKLNIVLGWPQLHAMSGVESGPAAWKTVLEIAEELGETDYQLRALWALWVDRTNSGDHRAALELAETFLSVCENGSAEPDDYLIAHRMMGRSLHMLGRQAAARERTEFMLQGYRPSLAQEHAVRFQYDQRATAGSTLARVLYVQGHRAEAIELIGEVVHDALLASDAPSLCHVLSDAACLVAIWGEDWDMAAQFISLLREWSSQTAMDVWSACGDAYAAITTIERGELALGVMHLQEAIVKLEDGGFVLHLAQLRAKLAIGLARLGRFDEAIGLLECELARCMASSDNWILPEMIRLKCDLEAARAGRYTPDVLFELERARGLAEQQGALEWELRIVFSIARAVADLDGVAPGISIAVVQARATGSTSRYADRLGALAGHSPEERGQSPFTTLY